VSNGRHLCAIFTDNRKIFQILSRNPKIRLFFGLFSGTLFVADNKQGIYMRKVHRDFSLDFVRNFVHYSVIAWWSPNQSLKLTGITVDDFAAQ